MSKAKPYKPKANNSSLSKGIMLYFFLLPLAISLVLSILKTDIKAFIISAISFLLFLVVAKLSSKGFAQEKEYVLSTLTKAPKIQYKSLSAFLLGFSTTFVAYFSSDKGLIISIFFGVISTVGYFLYYGFDPRDDKLDNIGDISAKFVLETISEAKEKLSKIDKNREKISDTTLINSLDVSLKKANLILENIEKDPKDIRVARKFLIVYIDGILNLTDSYLDLDEDDISSERKSKLYDLMSDLNTKFDKELDRLKNNNLFDLDVNIEVLNQQIKN